MKTVEPGQAITLRTNDVYNGAPAIVERIWSSGDVSVTVTGEDEPLCVKPSEIEGIETHICERCGATVTALVGLCETYRDYLWDGNDGEGSVLHEFTRWMCRDLNGCASRRTENAIGAMVEAKSADASARENGWGVIRNFRS